MPTPDEASYLAALLDSDVPNQAIKPFQARGLLGERHIQKKVLEVPIPRFDPRDPAHRWLVELGREAQQQAQRVAPTLTSSRLLGRQRSAMRAELAKFLAEIDALARQILSGPA